MNFSEPPLPPNIGGNLQSLEEQLLILEGRVRKRIFSATKTPLQNFEAFEALWPEFITQKLLHLLFVEVDAMKRLNNEFGHDNADQFLSKLGEILRDLRSEQVCAFHMSGDEFLVITCNLPEARVEDLATRILHNVRQSRVLLSDKEEKFTVSIGITKVDPREENRVARDLAEDAMKRAKLNGRDQHIWFLPGMEKQKPLTDVRRDCSNCQTHFSFSVEEDVYRGKESFFCPMCGEVITR